MDRDRYKQVPKPSETSAPERPVKHAGAPKPIPMTPKKQPVPIDAIRPAAPLKKPVQEPDILDVWAKQDAIRVQDKKVEDEYKATKAKAKALKKQLKENDQEIPGDTIAINLALPAMPKFNRPKFKVRKKVTIGKKLVIVGSFIGVLAIVGFGATQVLPGSKGKPAGQVQGATASAQKPDFDIITSPTTPTQQVKFDGEKKVAQFPDKVGDTTVVVSQQQLPDNFKSDPENEVKKLAEGFSATDVLTGGDQIAYLGTSAKGAQTVVLQKNGLLIFLFSTESIGKDVWSDYIATLK